AAAPSQLASPTPRAEPKVGLRQFRVRKLNPHAGAPMTCLIKIDPARRRLLAGDAFGSVLFTLNATGELARRTRLPSPPVSLDIREQGLTATLSGRIFPSDALEGGVVLLPGNNPGEARPLLEGLRRPADAVVADLNGDGREDLVVCSFGYRLGRFS